MCIPSKAGALLVLYSVIVGALYSVIITLGAITAFKAVHNNFIGESYLISLAHILMGLTAVVLPFGGFVADICCGRFRTYMVGLFLTTTGVLCLYLSSVMFITHSDNLLNVRLPLTTLQIIFLVMFCVAAVLVTLGWSAYLANYVQLVHDQLMEAPSRYLTLSTHWVIWANQAPFTIVVPFFLSSFCFKQKLLFVLVSSMFLGFLILFTVLLIFGSVKRHWFHIEPRQRNPYKMVFKVLDFARKHKHPLQRSAFTYCDDERPSRLDFAKERYGGPFTTEQVEDVKTFLRMIAVFLAIGPVFVLEVPSSLYFLPLFGAHVASMTSRFDHSLCNIHSIVVEGSSLGYIVSFFFFPLYLFAMFFVCKKIPRMFLRLGVGIALYFLGGLCMFAIDASGHMNKESSHCMFDIVLTNDSRYFSTLNMPWSSLVPPDIMFGIGPLLVMITTFEFISAQSPHSMKGLLVGFFLAIKGFFQFISSIALLPFSLKNLWFVSDSISPRTLRTDCVFGYLLFTSIVALIGLVLFSVVAKGYKYRERDDRPFDQRFADNFYSRVIQERSRTISSQSLESESENISNGCIA